MLLRKGSSPQVIQRQMRTVDTSNANTGRIAARSCRGHVLRPVLPFPVVVHRAVPCAAPLGNSSQHSGTVALSVEVSKGGADRWTLCKALNRCSKHPSHRRTCESGPRVLQYPSSGPLDDHSYVSHSSGECKFRRFPESTHILRYTV